MLSVHAGNINGADNNLRALDVTTHVAAVVANTAANHIFMSATLRWLVHTVQRYSTSVSGSQGLNCPRNATTSLTTPEVGMAGHNGSPYLVIDYTAGGGGGPAATFRSGPIIFS